MTQFAFRRLKIPEVIEVTPFFAEDERGYFLKGYEKGIFLQNGIETDLYEDFESFSKQGVLRGLHYQQKEPQSKIVRVLTGRIYDVAVDMRKGSATCGEWVGCWLDATSHNALFIPKGFAHGFYVESASALVSYKCTGPYLMEFDTGIRWDDPDIKIQWPFSGTPLLSRKDAGLPLFHTKALVIT